MAYFKDMEPLTYGGSLDHEKWNCPLLAVGWLDILHLFNKEPMKDRDKVVEKLRKFIEKSEGMWHWGLSYRGSHGCGFCPPDSNERRSLSGSYANMLIPDVYNRRIYGASCGILHYVEEHGYTPPPEFIDALMDCRAPNTVQYLIDLKTCNGGYDPVFMR